MTVGCATFFTAFVEASWPFWGVGSTRSTPWACLDEGFPEGIQSRFSALSPVPGLSKSPKPLGEQRRPSFCPYPTSYLFFIGDCSKTSPRDLLGLRHLSTLEEHHRPTPEPTISPSPSLYCRPGQLKKLLQPGSSQTDSKTPPIWKTISSQGYS